MSNPPQQAFPRILASSEGRLWTALDAAFLHIPRGKAEVTGRANHVLGMHVGRPVSADCRVGDRRIKGLQKPGDMDFIPAGVDGCWEDDADCQILRIGLKQSLMAQTAEDLGQDMATVRLAPQLQMRDPGIEAILWAIKADLDAPTPAEPLYIDHLAHALAVRLLTMASPLPASQQAGEPRLPPHELSHLIDFIAANLDRRLTLADLAMVAGLSVTRLKVLFRNSTGMPVHHYVMRRRADHARSLLATTTMPASEIALAAGFAHQSHMASTMRRFFGLAPHDIDRPKNTIGPNLRRSA